jgi:uncharacterized protein (TIGR02996 family)
MHEQFLSALRESPSDVGRWLVYADWLDDGGDPTGPFVRLSLALAVGEYGGANVEERLAEFEKLFAVAHPETRKLLANYRASLPTRFRVLRHFLIGSGLIRTCAMGFLESGRIKLGTDLGVRIEGRRGLWRISQGDKPIILSPLTLIEAGRIPIQARLCWWLCVPIVVGSVLTEVPASGAANTAE